MLPSSGVCCGFQACKMGSANDQPQPNTNVPFDSKSNAIPSTRRHGPSITLPSDRTLETPSTQSGKWASEVNFQDGLAVASLPNFFGSFVQMDQHFQLTHKNELPASFASNSNHAYDYFTDQSLTSDLCKLNLNDPTRPQVESRTSSYHYFLPSKSHSSN